jgi:hypothetical protein
MKKLKTKIVYMLLGAIIMFVLDMMFHFNNSVEAAIDRESKKAQRKIENIFK